LWAGLGLTAIRPHTIQKRLSTLPVAVTQPHNRNIGHFIEQAIAACTWWFAPMISAIVNEIIRLGGDPTDEVWRWLVMRGPHGDSFTWGQTRQNPPGYVGVDHLRRIVEEFSQTIPDFSERARVIVHAALTSDQPELVRRAIQIAAVIGGPSEIHAVRQLANSPQAEVAADARACVFYLTKRRA
jgi:hypothetical protein